VIRVRWKTFGCKANQADTDALRDEVAARLNDDVSFVPSGQSADVVVMNTCTVTHQADADARKSIRRARRENPGAKIIVTGCYAQVAGKKLETWDEIDHVVGNIHKATIPGLITDLAVQGSGSPPVMDSAQEDWNPSLRSVDAIRSLPMGRSRPFLKVQDGCNYVCSFCIIPEARGTSRSLSLSDVLASAQRLETAGAREVVLTGIHLGHWGRDLTPKTSLCDLLEALLEATSEVRFRISSLEPNEVTERFLDLVASRERICNHLHVPLQSGDDDVLKKMRRVYRSDWYRHIFSEYRRRVPDGGWGIDVMTGFPGETDEAFQNTYRFLRSIDCTYLHVFPYSPREGTVAATMSNPVPPEVKKKRTQALIALSETVQRLHWERTVGQTRLVLVENVRTDGLLRGMTDTYVPVCFAGPDALMESLVSVQVQSLGMRGTRGVLLGY